MRSATFGTRLVLVTLALAVLVACLAPLASAQDPDRRARLVLVSMPVAHGPGDDLDVRLQIVNRGDQTLEGFRLTVGAGDIIRSRSELHSSFETATLFTSFPLDLPNLEIPPGGRKTVRVNNPVGDLIALGTEGGVHPMSFSLFSAEDSFTPLDSLTTQLMVYPSEPEQPLDLVPLVTLDDIPARAPDGTFFVPDDAEQNPLEEATADTGWLRAVVGGLTAATAVEEATVREDPEPRRQGGRDNRREPEPEPPPEPLRVGLAATPRLVEELATMADGYIRSEDGEEREVPDDAPEVAAATEVLASLRGLVSRAEVQPILVPYSYSDLPTLEEQLGGGDVGLQLTEGLTVLDDALGLSLDRGWVFPPGGRLDAPSLQALQAAGVTDGVFVAPDSLESIDDPAGFGCPVALLSFTCSVRLETDVGGPIDGYVADADLQRRAAELSATGSGRVEMQRLLAETAMVHAEQPGTTGRVLQLTLPSAWRPKPSFAETFFRGLRDAPWLATTTPRDGLERADSPEPRRIVDEVGPLPNGPEDSYFDEIETAQEVVESFSSFLGQRGPREVLERLRRNLLVAQGRTRWDQGDSIVAAGYVDAVLDEATAEMRKVTIGVPSQTTFTSRTGSLDVSLFNETGYPIRATVLLRALDMEFDPATIDDTFPPGTSRISVQAEAQTSGTFPIEVRVETSNGHIIANEAVQVRSTEFNVVALAITIGAVAFLVAFYTVKALRRRRSRQNAEVSTS